MQNFFAVSPLLLKIEEVPASLLKDAVEWMAANHPDWKLLAEVKSSPPEPVFAEIKGTTLDPRKQYHAER